MKTEYSYLWENPSSYRLVDIGGDQLVIVDVENRAALIIEDDQVFFEVIKRMKEAGVSVTDKLEW